VDQYEYSIEEVNIGRLVERLNELGRSGWRFIAFLGDTYKRPHAPAEFVRVLLERKSELPQ
jgi:hypothetical protein